MTLVQLTYGIYKCLNRLLDIAARCENFFNVILICKLNMGKNTMKTCALIATKALVHLQLITLECVIGIAGDRLS